MPNLNFVAAAFRQVNRVTSVAAPAPAPALSGFGGPGTTGFLPTGTTYYVDQAAANDSGSGTSLSPKKYLSSGAALASPGDAVIIRNGTYSNALDTVDGSGGRGSSGGGYVYFAAENWGQVTCTIPPNFPKSIDHYKQFAGLRFDFGTANLDKGANGNRLRFFACGFGHGWTGGTPGGTGADNKVNWGVGTSDVTPGAQFQLYEDCYVYGVGGRYGFLVYNSDSITVRRLFLRHEKGWSDTKGDPQAGVSCYNSTNCLFQNVLCLDIEDDTNMTSNFYNPSNSRASDNNKFQGCIFGTRQSGITPTSGIAWDDGATCPNQFATNILTFGIAQPGNANGGVKTVTVDKWTSLNDFSNWRRYASGGTLTLSNGFGWLAAGDISNIGGVTMAGSPNQNNYYATSIAGCTNLNPATGTQMLWPVKLEAGTLKTAGRGAEILYQIGQSGTMVGDTGAETLQSTKLWPWFNEAQIRIDVRGDTIAKRGFAADAYLQMSGAAGTISSYVIEQQGNSLTTFLASY